MGATKEKAMRTLSSLSSKLLSNRLAGIALLCGVSVWSGCTSVDMAARIPMETIARMSPPAAVVTPYQAVELAHQYVSEHPGSDFAVGSGNSMLPLYTDHDVIVLERPALSELKPGQTVVFMGENGVPVAHILVNLTSRGWYTMGLNNPNLDPDTLSEGRYVGVVVKAYHPTGSPILAYWKTSPKNLLASNP
jgi:hypothetical protein